MEKPGKPKFSLPFDPECGEQDPSITQLSNGELMINFFQWFVVPEEEKDRLKYPARQQLDGSWADVVGPFVISSADMGKSWSKDLVYVDPSPLLRGGTSDAVLELPNGDLLMGHLRRRPWRQCLPGILRSLHRWRQNLGRSRTDCGRPRKTDQF